MQSMLTTLPSTTTHRGYCAAGAASWAIAGAAEEAGDSTLAVSDAWWLPAPAAAGAGMKLQRLVAKQLAPQVWDHLA